MTWRIGLGIGAVLLLCAFIAAVYFAGGQAAQDKAAARQAAADRKAQLERDGDDAKLGNLNDYDLCVAGMRSNGMPVDACQQLRGL